MSPPDADALIAADVRNQWLYERRHTVEPLPAFTVKPEAERRAYRREPFREGELLSTYFRLET